jgi:cell division septation protein DedD
MSTFFDTNEHPAQEERQDKEFTLSTASLLGIFFALVLVCGVFFGFGYSMGRRSGAEKSTDKSADKSDIKSGSAPVAANATTTVANQTNSDTMTKPSASQQAPPPVVAAFSTPSAPAQPERTVTQSSVADSPQTPVKKAATADTVSGTEPAVSLPRPSPAKRPAAEAAVVPPSKPLTTVASTSVTAPVAASSPTTSQAASQAAAGQPTIVQIAAVSHQEDADVLIAALKKRGYNVAVRHEPQDQLMHVQVGPFTNRADAVAMRSKLLSDGYNAILKP